MPGSNNKNATPAQPPKKPGQVEIDVDDAMIEEPKDDAFGKDQQEAGGCREWDKAAPSQEVVCHKDLCRSMRYRMAVVVAAGARMSLAQSASTVALSNGVQLHIAASLGEPTGQQSVKIELARASGNSFYRIFRDQNNLATFAYELAVDRSADGSEISLTARPVETEFAARFPNADGGKPVPTLSADKSFPSLRSGASVQIGLFELAGMGLKVVDRVEVRMTPAGVAADVPMNSSQIRLRFSGIQVSIDHQPVAGAGIHASVSGRYVMFYVPGRGGYFFATEQPSGRVFLKAGDADGNRLKFTLDNEIFECVADSPILAGVSSGEVWVYHDPGYKPEGNWTRAAQSVSSDVFFAAASDSLSWWLP